MSDSDQTPEPTHQASSGAAPVEPPPASGAQEGVVPTPPGESSPPGAAALVETPVQGEAVIAGQPIPPVEAQPVVPLVEASKLKEALEAAALESAAPGAEVPPILEAEEVVPNQHENPFDTIQRMRTKLAGYGVECLETVRPEIEYLLSLCGAGG